jgi:hypothetical protein
MKQLCKGTILGALAVIVANLIASAHGGQVTTYLQPLDSAVTNRLANTNLSNSRRQTLRRADTILTRDAVSKQKELGLLGSAARTLNGRFDDDFLVLEWDALAAYSFDAHALLTEIQSTMGTNPVPRSVNNSLRQATNALAKGDSTNNAVPARARAIATSLTKLDKAGRAVLSQFGAAPATLDGYSSVRFDEDVIINDRTFYNLHTAGWIYDSHVAEQAEELGLWTYTQQGSNNAIITVMPNWPSNDVPRDFKLVFTNFASGFFSGTNVLKNPIKGTFHLNRQ